MIGKLSSTYRLWKKHSNYLSSLPDKLEVVNTGSTPFFNAFDYKLWKCKGGNLAFQPQPLYYDIETLKNYKDRLAENAIILFGVEEFKLCLDFYNDVKSDYKYYLWLNDKQIRTYSNKTSFLVRYLPFVAYPQLIWRDIKTLIKVLIRYHVSQRKESSSESDDIRFAHYWLNSWKEEFHWNKFYDLTIEQKNNIEINKKRLCNAIKEYKEKKYRPYIVIPPFSPNLIKILPEQLLNDCLWNPIAEISKEQGIEIIDCYHDPKFADWTLYANALTLNNRGRILFNNYIKENLNLTNEYWGLNEK